MSVEAPFFPRYKAGQPVAPGAASAIVTIGKGSKTLCITNLSSSVWSYVAVGDSDVTATAADYPIPPGSQVSISKNQDHDTVAHIAPAGGGSLHIIPGEGF